MNNEIPDIRAAIYAADSKHQAMICVGSILYISGLLYVWKINLSGGFFKNGYSYLLT